MFSTGLINIQLWYPFGFGFVPAHYYGAILFLAGLGFHLVLKIPVMRRAFHERGLLPPLRAPRTAILTLPRRRSRGARCWAASAPRPPGSG